MEQVAGDGSARSLILRYAMPSESGVAMPVRPLDAVQAALTPHLQHVKPNAPISIGVVAGKKVLMSMCRYVFASRLR